MSVLTNGERAKLSSMLWYAREAAAVAYYESNSSRAEDGVWHTLPKEEKDYYRNLVAAEREFAERFGPAS